MKNILVSLLGWLVILTIPVVLVLGTARAVVQEWYPRYEYAKPDFPPDTYGWTQEERLERATAAIRYLNSPLPPDEAITILREQHHPGTESMLYTRFEIQHMLDVKYFTDTLWRVLRVAAVALAAGLIVLLWQRATRATGFWAIMSGGILTSALLIGLAAFVLLGWRTFFITFHEIFFPPGSWTFDWTDSLIRLFPDKFWFDGGVLITGSVFVEGVLVALAGYFLWRRASQTETGGAARSVTANRSPDARARHSR